MAKRFAGFTPDQLGKIVPEMSGMQADEQKKFLASNPAAAARVGMMTEKAQMALNKGGYIKSYANGGLEMDRFNAANKAALGASNTDQTLAEPQRDRPQNPFVSGPVPLPRPENPLMSRPILQERPQNPFTGQAVGSVTNDRLPPVQLDINPQKLAFEQFQNSTVANSARSAQQNIERQVSRELGFDSPTNQEQADQYNTRMQQLVNQSPEIQTAREAQTALDASQQNYSNAMGALQAAKDAQSADPANADLVKAVTDAEAALTLAGEQLQTSTDQYKTTEVPNTAELVNTGLTDPTSMTTKADVQTTQVGTEQLIDPATGQLTGTDPTGTTAGVTPAATIADPTATEAPTVDPTMATTGVKEELEGFTGATGTVSTKVDPATGELSEGAILDEDARVAEDRIKEAEAGTREVQDDELVTGAKLDTMPAGEAAEFGGEIPSTDAAKFAGSTPQAESQDFYNLTPTQIASMSTTTVSDAAKADYYPTAEAATTAYNSMVKGAQGTVGSSELVNAKDITAVAESVTAVAATMDAVNEQGIAKAATGSFNQTMLAQAAQGSVPAQSTIAGQMEKLMNQFNDGTPAWAAGAMRAANAAMNGRGLGYSSMAGAAIVQATMESALPIAQADAAVFERMNMKNIDNRQQVALSNAAAQQGMELQNLSNEQQVALTNSAQAFDLQKTNLSNQQAVVLANAQMKAGLQEQVLGLDTQIALTNASKFAERNNLNLTNQQQAILQRSSENLTVEMKNLSNQQETALSSLQVKAAMMGQELTNEQQMAVLESTQRFEAAEFDASAKQQAFLADASAQAALEGKALDARQQTQLFNISSILEERKIELTNEQQTRIFNTTNKVNVDMEEMSNRQQTALANVQIEATLRGQELNNDQQSAVLNAEKFAEANNLTFTTEAQMSLANSQMMQSIGLAEMDANSARALQNAAQLASMDMANLNNRQQAQVENAKNFLQMDMANLSNEQQTTMFSMQSTINSMMSDQAADNAAKQFNASSEMQTDQFFANLTSTINMFNSEQHNNMEKFSAGEKNAMTKFNSELINMRDQFNATNSLVVEQANTQWFQTVATTDTAAINQANRDEAMAANQFTNSAFNAIMQETRDLMSFAWQTANNDADRATTLAVAKMSSDDAKAAASAKKSSGMWGAIGSFAAALIR